MQPEIQITVYNARAEVIYGIINPITSLEFELFQSGNNVIIDIFYTFGLFETEVDEIVFALEDEDYEYGTNDIGSLSSYG